MTQHSAKYLIIGGSTKCGTTSVFKYFEFHPQICQCSMKESRYFLEDSYKLIAKKRNSSENTTFSDLFQNCHPDQVRLEATPDYLYSKKAALKIKSELNNVKLVFILREPVDRLKSWYKFSTLNGLIEKNTSFEEYINIQNSSINENILQHLRSLSQGRYSSFLKTYYEIFNKDEIKIFFYENLVKNPKQFCTELSLFANVNPEYFNDFEFVIHNKSVPVKSVEIHKLFRKIKRSIRPATALLNSNIRKKLKLAGYKFESMYSSANQAESETAIEINPELTRYLIDYYKNETSAIYNLSGELPPWYQ